MNEPDVIMLLEDHTNQLGDTYRKWDLLYHHGNSQYAAHGQRAGRQCIYLPETDAKYIEVDPTSLASRKDAVKVGSILDESERQRDAIHVPIAPVTAGCQLDPGWHIKIENGVAIDANAEDSVGVVDPFLKDVVVKGQRFYIFMHPNTVTGIRHFWTHPKFKTS